VYDVVVRLLLVAAALWLGSCDPFAPYENPSRSVEGCNEAVAHLRSCCPAWDSYLSCNYYSNAVAAPDLSPGQSRCLAKKPCDEIQRAVESGSYLCSFSPSTRHCR
jgi:hypothetical protein